MLNSTGSKSAETVDVGDFDFLPILQAGVTYRF